MGSFEGVASDPVARHIPPNARAFKVSENVIFGHLATAAVRVRRIADRRH